MKNKVKCLICSKYYGNLTTHLIKTEKVSKKQYLSKFPNAEIVSDAHRDKQRKIMRDKYQKDPESFIAARKHRTFGFIKNKKLQSLLLRDYKSANICLENELWKPSIILYGSLIEAILREKTETNSFKTALDKALNEKIISDDEFHQIHLVRDSRNFVHLHKELENRVQVVNEWWAKTLSDICESLIKSFRNEEKL